MENTEISIEQNSIYQIEIFYNTETDNIEQFRNSIRNAIIRFRHDIEKEEFKIFTHISIKIIQSYRNIKNFKVLFDATILNQQDNYNELVNDLYSESEIIIDYYKE